VQYGKAKFVFFDYNGASSTGILVLCLAPALTYLLVSAARIQREDNWQELIQSMEDIWTLTVVRSLD
jgi:hypothetical protein